MPLASMTDVEKYEFDSYRRDYAFGYNECRTDSFEDVDYILRIWNSEKSNYLYRLLGERLIVEKEVNFKKDVEELVEDFYCIFNNRYDEDSDDKKIQDRIKAKKFRDAYLKFFVEDNQLNLDKELVKSMQNLISGLSLMENKYIANSFGSKPCFCIPYIENGKEKKIKITGECKVSKVLGKIAKIFEIPCYEEFRIIISQILNQKETKGKLCLSIHPLDYATMSDNDCDWDSCMSWQAEGSYRQGTVEMMNSQNVIVAYLKSEDDMNLWYRTPYGDTRCGKWSNKKWRQLFVVDYNVLASIKAYPYENIYLSELIVDWIADLAKENLSWTYRDSFIYSLNGDKNTHHIEGFSEEKDNFGIYFFTNKMYNDFGCTTKGHVMKINANISEDDINSDWRSKPYLNICYSGSSECMVCGQTSKSTDFYDESCLACEDCQNTQVCDNCGDRCNETHYVDGMELCNYCYNNNVYECAECGDEHLPQNMRHIYIIPRTEAKKELHYNEMSNLKFYYDISDNEVDTIRYIYCHKKASFYLDKECIDNWIENNLKEGCNFHLRDIEFNRDYCVYFDELLDEAKERFIPFSWRKNEEVFIEWLGYYSITSSRVVEKN